LFVHVDDFCQAFLPHLEQHLLTTGAIKRRRERSLSISEVMTILIHFHQSHYRNFKAYYCEHVLPHLHSEFPDLVSYTRFVDFIPSALLPLCAYFLQTCLGDCTGVSFIDSTSLDVCLNQRIASHKVFAGLATRGKTSAGWFFGFKLHAIIDMDGRILQALLLPANIQDRHAAEALAEMVDGGIGLGDHGYLGADFKDELAEATGLLMVTPKDAGQRRALISTIREKVETVFSQLWARFIDRIHSRSWLGLWNTVKLKLLHYNLVTAGLLTP
jgi:transposase